MAPKEIVVKNKPNEGSRAINPWQVAKDPNGSDITYWWNPETNESTALGAPKPQHWVEVKDPNGSNLTYWWNVDTGETTQLGSPNPNQQFHSKLILRSNEAPVSFGKHMINMAALGFGMSFAIIIVRGIMGF